MLAYLGVVASGLCFFLWNRGAQLVAAGQLAVMNNLKIPLGVAVSLFVFREPANFWTLLVGALLIGVALLPVRKTLAPRTNENARARSPRVAQRLTRGYFAAFLAMVALLLAIWARRRSLPRRGSRFRRASCGSARCRPCSGLR